MADLTAQQHNFIAALIAKSKETRNMQLSYHDLIAEWNLNDMFNQLDDAAVIAAFPHLDKSKVGNAINALTAILDALGDDSSGQATNLIKMQG